MFFSKKKKINEIDMSRLPQHIGIIMDGNGRWAKKRGLPRSAGHSAGADSLKKIITEANNLGVKYITVYAFSTENWKRPKEEVDYLMSLLLDYLRNAEKNSFGRECCYSCNRFKKRSVRRNLPADYKDREFYKE